MKEQEGPDLPPTSNHQETGQNIQNKDLQPLGKGQWQETPERKSKQGGSHNCPNRRPGACLGGSAGRGTPSRLQGTSLELGHDLELRRVKKQQYGGQSQRTQRCPETTLKFFSGFLRNQHMSLRKPPDAGQESPETTQ